MDPNLPEGYFAGPGNGPGGPLGSVRGEESMTGWVIAAVMLVFFGWLLRQALPSPGSAT